MYRLTKEECERGWLLGPLSPSDIPSDAVLTRRFGVTQTSADAEHGTVKKIRPIDDFTESLANLTSSAEETIEPHSISVIAAGILLRLRGSRKYGRKEKLKMKTVDLRKAYKQLPLSEAALVKSRSRAADFFTLSQTRSVQRLQAIVKHFTSKFHSNNTA